MQKFLTLIVGAIFTLVALAQPAMAQRRTLFDLLFGEGEPQQAEVQEEQAAPARPVAPSASTTVIAAPSVDKNETATRLLVMGDSLARDLSNALERAFAEDANLFVVDKSVGSSGFVRDDFYDWNAALQSELDADSFDMAVVIIGINDRQPIGSDDPLSDAWKQQYAARLDSFLGKMRAASKPVVWVGLPPMRSRSYSQAISEISNLHRLASVAGGADFVDIYERFTDDVGNYSDIGPDLSGQSVRMRKQDGIHFSSAGSDKLAFFVSQVMRTYYQGGSIKLEVADLLEGTVAAQMVRLPLQGLGQVRLLEVAGAVAPLEIEPSVATKLILAPQTMPAAPLFSLEDLANAPKGRADAFGVGQEIGIEDQNEEGPNQL